MMAAQKLKYKEEEMLGELRKKNQRITDISSTSNDISNTIIFYSLAKSYITGVVNLYYKRCFFDYWYWLI